MLKFITQFNNNNHINKIQHTDCKALNCAVQKKGYQQELQEQIEIKKGPQILGKQSSRSIVEQFFFMLGQLVFKQIMPQFIIQLVGNSLIISSLSYFNLLQYLHIMNPNQYKKGKQDSPEQVLKKISSPNLNSKQGINEFIGLVRSLKPGENEFHTIKKLMIHHRLPIMIYFKPFYQKITQKLKQQYQESLQALASIAYQITQKQIIPQIGFLFEYERKPYNLKIPNDETDKQFLQFVVKLGKLNAEMVSKKSKLTIKQYKNLIQKQMEKQHYTQFVKKSIEEYRLSDHIINQLAKQENSQEQSGYSEQWEEEDFVDFYSHQNVTKQSTQSSINISYSLNQSDIKDKLNISTAYIKQQSSEPICCRTYFTEKQFISQAQNARNSFLKASFPFTQQNKIQMKILICAFLNGQGGTIYVGVGKNQKGQKMVENDTYTESDKEQILRQFRKMAQAIDTQLITQKMYKIGFVPVQRKNGSYIPGGYVIKVTVSYGVRDQFYCYEKDGVDHFPFRSDAQIFQRKGKQLLKSYKIVVKNPMPIPVPLHTQPCKQPELGQPLHQFKQRTKITQKPKKKQEQDSTKVSQSQSMEQNTKISESGLTPHLNNRHDKQDKVGHTNAKYTYFYVVGLDEKHLVPIFANKNIINNVKIQSTKQQRLVIKVVEEIAIQTAKKILAKIQQKYKERGIKVYEMSLVLQVQDIVSAIQSLKRINSKFKISEYNRIKFKLYGECYKAYTYLQSNKIEAKFIHSE